MAAYRGRYCPSTRVGPVFTELSRRRQLPRRDINVPIFPRHGNRMVAVNPALVRSVETQTSGGCKIIFDHQHELMVDASLYEIIKALWGSSPMAEIKELTATPV